MKDNLDLEVYYRAPRPTLFDAAAFPELLIALIYANLMSPALWELKRRLHTGLRQDSHENGAQSGSRIMEAIHQYVNKKFYHPGPLDMAKICGLINLDEERERLPEGVVDGAVNIILKSLEGFRAEGKLSSNQDIFEMAAQGKFPEYEYSGIDVIEALGRSLQRKHRPLGVTMCADEAVLIASLALVEGAAGLEDIAILGSPAHYTLFVAHANDRFWFNGKREFHDAQSWQRTISQLSSDQICAAFKERIVEFDRVITPFGTHDLKRRQSSFPKGRLKKLFSQFEAFFGFDIQQAAAVKGQDIHCLEESATDVPLMDVGSVSQALQFEKLVHELAAAYPGSIYELALYAFRSIHVEQHQAYLQTAMRGRRTREKAAEIQSIPQALKMVAEIPGATSIFHSLHRLTLPDEVLQFQTGNQRDKALLLYCLILHAPAIPAALKTNMVIDLSGETDFLRVGSDFLDPPL